MIRDLAELGEVEEVHDIHCVTRWSRFDVRVRGVPLKAVLSAAEPLAEAKFILFSARSARGHTTSLPLRDALDLGVLLVTHVDDAPLTAPHGGPVRSFTPGRYFYKSLKWLERLTLLAEDRLGYWEAESGYHNHADPWNEERYVAGNLDRAEARRLIEGRDFSGRDLLSFAGASLDLTRLKARGAKLRNADFRHTVLAGADFSAANLSNAHLEGADCRGATFAGADIEGADFIGSDLRGADLRGASLFGVTFVGSDPAAGARLDATTQIGSNELEALAPQQAEFVCASMRRK